MTTTEALDILRAKFPNTYISMTATLDSHCMEGEVRPLHAEVSVWIEAHGTHHRAHTLEQATQKALDHHQTPSQEDIQQLATTFSEIEAAAPTPATPNDE